MACVALLSRHLPSRPLRIWLYGVCSIGKFLVLPAGAMLGTADMAETAVAKGGIVPHGVSREVADGEAGADEVAARQLQFTCRAALTGHHVP